MQLSKRVLTTISVASLLFLSVAQAAPTTTITTNSLNSFNPQQTLQIEKIVHDYLIKNPQVMVEVVNALQKKQQEGMMKKAESSITSNTKTLFNAKTSPTVGNPQGKVTLVEFFDYQCPHCKSMGDTINNLIKSNSELKVVYKELPIFPNSAFISKAALASVKQGKFAAFHAALMQAPDPISQADVMKIAQSLGIDTNKLTSDMNDSMINAELITNNQLANALGLQGTPAFIIASNVNSQDKNKMRIIFIPGEVSQTELQNSINQALNAARQ